MHGGVFAAHAVCGVRGATAVALVGDALYVGTASGMLATYALRDGGAEPVSEVRVARRGVAALAYLGATDQLAVLADGCVTLVARAAPAERTGVPTRGVRCMHVAAWTEGGCGAAPRAAARRGMDVIAAERTRAPQAPVHVSLLVLGCRRQLVVYRWVGARFLDTHAAALPHTPHAFGGVADPPSVFVGFLGAYARLVVPPAAASTAPPPADAAPSAAAERVDRSGRWAVYAVPARAPERAPLLARAHAEPRIAPAGARAAVLVHEHDGVFVDAHGRRTGQVLALRAAPDALAYSPPFVVCAARGALAVYARETLREVQRLALGEEGAGGTHLAVDGTRAAALVGTHVHVLERQPPRAQLDALVRAGEFDEARTLLDTLRDDELAHRGEWRTRVHACVGVAHFAAGRFDAAIDTFLELGVNPVHVLALYPASVAGTLARAPDEWLAAFGVAAPLPDTPDAGARAALDALARFLSEHRRVLRAHLEAAGMHDKGGGEGEGPAPDTPFLPPLDPAAAAGLARIVDTALIKTFLRTKPALVAPLCRVDNWCSVAHVRTLLEERAMFAELAALYRGKEMHAAALALLRAQHMPRDAAAYLQTLGARWLRLVLEHAHWVLRADVHLGLQIFVADTGRVHELPREAVAADLEAFDRDVCRMYLERVAPLGGRALHTRLGRLYLECAPADAPHTLAFLRTADCDAAALLAAAPAHAPAVRATLLGRLARHDEALRIYVHELHDHAAAAHHCAAHVHAAPHIFESLLRLFLADGDARAAQELATQHAAHIRAATALALMPRAWRVADVAAFFVRAQRTRAARAQAARVHASLLAARDAQLGDAVRALCARRVVVGEGRTCPRCERRLAGAVVAVVPATGETLHYFCAHRR